MIDFLVKMIGFGILLAFLKILALGHSTLHQWYLVLNTEAARVTS